LVIFILVPLLCQYFFQKSVEASGKMERQNICDLQIRPFNDILSAHPSKPEAFNQTHHKIWLGFQLLSRFIGIHF